MKNIARLIAVILIYEQTTFNVAPCGQQWAELKVAPPDKLFFQQACIEKRVHEVSRSRHKSKKEAEKNKSQPEINGFAYRIEETK